MCYWQWIEVEIDGGYFMENIATSSVMLVLAIIVVSYFTVQSVFFIIKAWRRGTEIGLTSKQMRKVATNSMVVSIIPAFSNVLLLATFIGALGSFFSWMRISILGSPVYLQLVTTTTMSSYDLPEKQYELLQSNPNAFLSNVWVITIVILVGLLFDVLFLKKFDTKVKANAKGKNAGFSEMVIACMFPSLMTVFVVPEVLTFLPGAQNKTVMFGSTALNFDNFMNIIAMVCALVITLVMYGLAKKTKKSVFKDFALPASIIFSMALIIGINLIVK